MSLRDLWMANLRRDPVERRRRVRRLLWLALGLSVLLLALERGPVWYYDPRPANPPGHVVVYSTAWCPSCSRLRDCFAREHVPYEERDIERSKRAADEYEALGGDGVPTTLIGQRAVTGRSRELKEALAAAGYDVECAAGSTRKPSTPAAGTAPP